jgi:hypothetical protein
MFNFWNLNVNPALSYSTVCQAHKFDYSSLSVRYLPAPKYETKGLPASTKECDGTGQLTVQEYLCLHLWSATHLK